MFTLLEHVHKPKNMFKLLENVHRWLRSLFQVASPGSFVYRKVAGQMNSVLGYPCNLNLLFASQYAPDSLSEHLKYRKFQSGRGGGHVHITQVASSTKFLAMP